MDMKGSIFAGNAMHMSGRVAWVEMMDGLCIADVEMSIRRPNGELTVAATVGMAPRPIDHLPGIRSSPRDDRRGNAVTCSNED